MVLSVIYGMGRGESLQRRNSSGFSVHWGNSRLGIATWFTFLLLLFQLLDQATVTDGFPMADGISQAAARAAVAAAMNSNPRTHHHHRGNLMRERENGDGEVEGNIERDEMESSLPRLQAVELLLHKVAAAAARKAEAEEEMEREEQQEEAVEESRTEKGRGRALWPEDYQRRASELCRTSATLQCGKHILTLSEGHEKGLSVHMKCDLRDDFLKCIDREKNDCLELAESSILPELPPKEMIKVEQSKLWNVLWAAGGCVLSH